MRGDDAAADVAEGREHRLTDLHPRPQPRVLGVGVDTVDLEQHAEAAPIDRRTGARLLPQPAERSAGDERDGAAAQAAVGRALVGPQQRQRPSQEAGDRRLPRAADSV